MPSFYIWSVNIIDHWLTTTPHIARIPGGLELLHFHSMSLRAFQIPQQTIINHCHIATLDLLIYWENQSINTMHGGTITVITLNGQHY